MQITKRLIKLTAIPLLIAVMGGGAATLAQTNIEGRRVIRETVQSDTLKAAATRVLAVGAKQWYALNNFQFFSAWFTIAPSDCTYFAGQGWGTADTVEVTYELYSGSSTPTSASTGFWEHGDSARKSLIELSVGDTTQANWYKSFHGTGDPEIALADWIRFYVTVDGGFTAGGIDFDFIFLKQP